MPIASATVSSRTRRLAAVIAAWAACYAAYRFYYAFGGRIGMVGVPAPAAHFRHDNLVGAIIILTGALLPLLALPGWRHASVRRAVATTGWVVAVGCCMHALTLETIRVLSLSGVRPTHYPSGLWLSINRRQADLQDALFNEPWFFVTGLLCAMFALTAVRPAMRRRWRCSAAVATVLAAAVGVLSGLDVIPTFRS